MKRSRSGELPVAFMLLFALFWNGFVAVFDVVLVTNKLHQIDARSRFVDVEATVTSSRVVTNNSGDGTSYMPEVVYRYVYGGSDYESDRYSFTIFGASDHDHAHAVVDAHPEGTQVTAYVDPDDPQEAVLDIDGTSFPTFIVLFLTPFHCVGIWFMGRLVRERRRRRHPDRTRTHSRFVAIERPDHLVIRRPRLATWEVFLFAFGLLTFLAIFPLAFLLGMMEAGAYALPVLGASAAVALLLAALKRAKNSRPSEFLHIDRRLGVFAYPADQPGTRISAVRSVEVDSRKTNVAINDVPQHDHRIFAQVDGLEVDVFEFRGGPDEGAEVRSLIAAELGVVD